MMIVGGAIITPLIGRLSEGNAALGYLRPLIGYIAVAAFSVYITRQIRERQALSTFEI
jgi:fucose permease